MVMSESTAITLLLHVALTFTGLVLMLLVSRVYKPYKTFQADRTIMKPVLLVGIFVALSGVTELAEPYIEWGGAGHAMAMLLSAFFTIFAIHRYHKTLERLDVNNYAKAVIKLKQEQVKNENHRPEISI